ncbi:MAG: hypothetical protein Q7T87_19270 [Polaromonas sp.]|nr:hypothetical protein [Polaromonas sp.]
MTDYPHTRHQPEAMHFMPGESLLFQTRSGDYLITTAGSLVMTGAPRWMAGQLWAGTMPLEPEAPTLVPHGGWIRLTAGPQGAACVLGRPADAPPGLVAWHGRFARVAGWMQSPGRVAVWLRQATRRRTAAG